VVLLDRDQLNLGVDVFVSIRIGRHNIEWLEAFARFVATFPEVVEFYRMSGQVDYLLRVVVPDIAAYDAFYLRLIEQEFISDISSAFAMEVLKYTTELPLDYVQS
jgi:Lrp/AsnC family transcriptional regulator